VGNLVSLQQISIRDNDGLTSLTGLENITAIDNGIYINNNDQLENLSGLNNLASAEEAFFITGNDNLSSLGELSNLTVVGDLRIIVNDNLSNLSGLENISSCGNSLYIRGNNLLSTLAHLENITHIGAALSIESNNSLSNLNGLHNIDSIGGVLSIINNPILSDIKGLENIESATITILRVSSNESLSDCDVHSVCDYLKGPNGIALISDNKPGCNSIEEVELACGLVSIEEEEEVHCDYTIYPNPFTKSTNITYELTEPSQVQVVIYNTIGESIYVVVDGMMPEGKHIHIWTAGQLSPGLYYAVIKTKESVSVLKMIKQ
jgi:hypothetical protein